MDATTAALQAVNLAKSGTTHFFDEIRRLVDEAKSTGNFTPVVRMIGSTFSSDEALRVAFLKDFDDTLFAGLDLAAVKAAYELLLSHESLESPLTNATNSLLLNVERSSPSWTSPAQLRLFLILLLNPLIANPAHSVIFSKLCQAVAHLSLAAKTVLQQWIQQFPAEFFQELLGYTQTFITLRVLQNTYMRLHEDPPVISAVRFLSLLWDANEVLHAARYTDFYNDAINDSLDLQEDFRRWYFRHYTPQGQEAGGSEMFFSFCDVAFVLDPASKSKILQFDAIVQQREQFDRAVLRSIVVRAQTSPYLVLRIRRERLLEDALSQLMSKPSEDLKKSLRVIFVGEEGIDAGGLQKEFFQLLIRNLFDVRYGMFVLDAESQNFWFNPASLENNMQFRLLLGIAIYNSIILDVRLPLVAYKRLMGAKPTLEDMEEVMPTVGRSLRYMLNYEGDVSTFGTVFQITRESYGAIETIDLKPDGGNIPVTNANREEYVAAYVDQILGEGVKAQFEAFYNGFHAVCGGHAIHLFRAEELELLICGNPVLDFAALEEGTRLETFTEDSPIIKWFWEILHGFDEIKKKKFLFFCTGSDRAPIKGLASLELVVERNGPDSDRLPTAHTCFNHLLLPEYESKEKLERMLLTAIENAEGFGLK